MMQLMPQEIQQNWRERYVNIIECRPVTRSRPQNRQVPIASPLATIEEVLETVFSALSMPRGYIARTPAGQ
jgi:hypothetical protein